MTMGDVDLRPPPGRPERPERNEPRGGALPQRSLRLAQSRVARLLWTAAGLASVGLGLLGAVLPVLPTTPFLILATACFARSSARLHARILNHRTFGPPIRDYLEGRGIDRRVKLVAIGTMWIFVTFALTFGLPAGRPWLHLAVGLIAIAGTLFLLRVPDRRP